MADTSSHTRDHGPIGDQRDAAPSAARPWWDRPATTGPATIPCTTCGGPLSLEGTTASVISGMLHHCIRNHCGDYLDDLEVVEAKRKAALAEEAAKVPHPVEVYGDGFSAEPGGIGFFVLPDGKVKLYGSFRRKRT